MGRRRTALTFRQSRAEGQPRPARRRGAILVKSVVLVVAVTSILGSFGLLTHPPEAPPGNPSAYAFIATQSDGTTPYSWDPCKPIHVVVNSRTAIKGGKRLVAEAIGEVEDATGLSFIVDGSTSEKPSRSRPMDVDRYRREHAPVLLAWSDPDESPGLSGDVLGYAQSESVISIGKTGRRPVYVTGWVTLDGPQLGELVDRRNGWARARAVVMHELGHLIGLDHIKARGESMQPKAVPEPVAGGRGDRAGLEILGSGKCITW